MRYLQAWSWIGLYFFSTWAKLINNTIDDTGPKITYLPKGAWNDGNNCENCTAKPDSGQMSSGTWHDSTFYPEPGSNDFPNQVLNASTIFNGTSVYVFCALSRSKASPFGNSDMTFYIDGQLVGIFLKPAPGTDGFDYDVPVYVNESLSPGTHELVLQNGHVNGSNSLVILDRIVYSFDDGTEAESSAAASPTSGLSPQDSNGSSSSNIGVIVGAVVAVSVIAILLGACFLIRRRRLKSAARGLLPPLSPSNTESPWAITPYLLTQRPSPSLHHSTASTSFNSGSELTNSMPSHKYGNPPLPSASISSTPRPQAGSPPPYNFTDAVNAPVLRLKR
ncbi:hypothetical protein VKT23_003105 [Stygiomarasmius scandens]|uniref:Uncharacterized protein n=1 Tax=Marasmiellus scandens TaxID=2682957 RepID=A0ABR1JW68_9AGAR